MTKKKYYTIAQLAKVNECCTYDAEGLAQVWQYWLTCNCNDKQSVDDFKSLHKADRAEMLKHLYGTELGWHILSNL